MGISATLLGDEFPGLADLAGRPGPDVLGGPLHRYLEKSGSCTWEAVASLTPLQISNIKGIGATRVNHILGRLSSVLGVDKGSPTAAEPESSKDHTAALQALVEIASWAVGTGRSGSVLAALTSAITTDELDAPRSALLHLDTLDIAALADEDRVALHDPVLAAERLLASFDERETATLDRILDFDGSAPTLGELGDRFGVSREWIRQIESKTTSRLDTAASSPEFIALTAAAQKLRDRLGAVVHASELAGEFACYPPDLLDRLMLHLAGPYRFDGDWYVLEELHPLRKSLNAAFEAVSTDGVASRTALLDSLIEMGMHRAAVERILAETERFSTYDDHVLDWRGSLADKVAAVLRAGDRPLTLDELVAAVQPNSIAAMTNQISTSSKIVRVGVKRFALAEWGVEEFPGIARAMADRLADGDFDLSQLAEELSSEFGCSRNSVTIMAGTHAAFVVDKGRVALRTAENPYVPKTDLTTTKSCFVVDGVWALRVPVDWDVVRGSGRMIPEAFAVHLGLNPLGSGSIDTSTGPIKLRWNQYPVIGSLRSLARSVEAEEGDFLFIRRVTPSSLDVRVVRADDLDSDPERRLRLLVGATVDDRSIEQVLADALSLRGTVNHDLAEERAVLQARKEDQLLELLTVLG